MGIIGIAFGLGFIFGPFIGGELARFPVLGREGTLPAFVAAGLSAINFLLALRTLPESLPPERRGKLGAARGAARPRRVPRRRSPSPASAPRSPSTS